MMSSVRLETRQAGSVRSGAKSRETVILRDDEVVAVLPEGDPLCQTLGLSVEELKAIRVNFARALDRRPWAAKAVEAIIEYKEDAGRERSSR